MMSEEGYAGDLSPQESWDLLKSDSSAQMIDVRTDAEFSFVGVADLTELGKKISYVSWLYFPNMDINPDFTADMEKLNFDKDQPLLFLCRSGVRSKHAAVAITKLGYTRCYNVATGFEGDKNEDLHRASFNGWKHDGLPWIQE